VIYTHRDFWQCYQFQDKYNARRIVVNLSNKKSVGQEERHFPTVKFLGSDDKPEQFPTRNCYPVQSQEFVQDVTIRLNLLVASTKLTFAPHRVCLVYDERMMKHKNIADP
jgi:histone deacetylase 6